jgi:DNA-binding NtrC family response regulator
MRTVLVVDDKEMMRDSVVITLERAGFTVVSAADGAAALELIARKRPDAVVTDMRMPAMTGIELLEKVRAIDDELPVVLMTAFGTIETAVKAMKLGAFDYLTKPFEGDELIISIKRAIEHRRLVRENAVMKVAAESPAATTGQSPTACRTGIHRLIGKSQAMQKLRQQIESLAGSQGTILITGESGVGKEVVARAVHELSQRRDGAFLAVNCAALSASLLESELFGHERGAFTGADRLRKGRFELADGGTLLLDEVSEVSPQIQAKLLRVLQERSFERVGSSLTIGVEVRVIATSNRDLPASVAKNDFRQDLYFRLNVLPITVPPLRERLEDVAELADHFAAEVCRREGRPTLSFEQRAKEMLQNYAWPGNVRELQNICERAVVLSAGVAGAIRDNQIAGSLVEPWVTGCVRPAAAAQIEPKPMGAPISANGNGYHANGTVEPRLLEDIEREAIIAALHKFNGHRQKTATALGIGVRTLGLKLKKWKEEKLVAETL